MTSIAVEVIGRIWHLTDEHAASSYGEPVLVDDTGQPYGPWDIAARSYPKDGNAVETIRYARAIAGFIRDDRSDDPTAMALLAKFEAVRDPSLQAS